MPIKYLVPKFNDTAIDLSSYLSLIIQSMVAISTFLAVLVALFKDELRKLWKNSELVVNLIENKITEELNQETGSEGSSSDLLKADKYISYIDIINSGNKSASEVELVIDQVVYESQDYPNPQLVSSEPCTLSWGATGNKKIDLSPKSKKRVQILELANLEEQSSPDGQEKSISPTLKIGPIESPRKFISGKWTAECVLFSKDSIPVRFNLKIMWNGKWEQRLTEMKDCLTLDIEEVSL